MADAARYTFHHRQRIKKLKPGSGRHQVLFVTPNFDAGGGELVSLNIARYTDQQEFSFHALATDRWRHRWKRQFENAFENALIPENWRLSQSGMARYLDHLIRHLGIDILVFYHNAPIFRLLPHLRQTHPRLRIIDINHYVPQDFWFAFTRTYIPLIDARVCISQSIADGLHRLYRENRVEHRLAGRILRIYNGINLSELEERSRNRSIRRELALPPGKRLVLFAGRFDPVKQARRFVEIAAQAKHLPDFHFAMAGDGEEMPLVQQDIQRLQLNRRVQLLGMLPEHQLAPLLAEAEVLLVTSDSEGIPMIALEALALRTLVFSTNCGGMHELIRDGETGLLVLLEADPLRDLVQHLESLYTAPESFEPCKEAGRRAVENDFSASAMGARYTSLFKRLLQEPPEASSGTSV